MPDTPDRNGLSEFSCPFVCPDSRNGTLLSHLKQDKQGGGGRSNEGRFTLGDLPKPLRCADKENAQAFKRPGASCAIMWIGSAEYRRKRRKHKGNKLSQHARAVQGTRERRQRYFSKHPGKKPSSGRS